MSLFLYQVSLTGSFSWALRYENSQTLACKVQSSVSEKDSLEVIIALSKGSGDILEENHIATK